ncbi:MAG: Serine/threonine-protein kinase PrkC [Acidimicrobiales bacterium]|nr:Serine/threonine-protein kinase PrkC [Acidimicrobiales bacterium]
MKATDSGVLIAERYELGPLLRRGGMADVHEGTDLRLERPVAIKLLRPDMADRADVRLRFESEARAAARLSHPNAVAVFDTGEYDGTPYIVMERLPGRTLADVIAEGPVDAAWLTDLAAGVLSALGAAHAAGIVHRDVKPANILLTADGRAKIADFGIAKSAELASGAGRGTTDLTMTGQLVGTPAYLAPERLAGAPATFLSDLYSMGVVLYEALAGEKPFAGANFLAVAQAVQSGQHRPLAEARPDLGAGRAAAVERGMNSDPSLRYPSAEAMAEALTGAPPTGAGTPGALSAGHGEETTLLATELDSFTRVSDAPPMPLALSPRRRRVPIVLPLAAAGALLVVLLLVLGTAGGSDPRPATATVPAPTVTTAAPPSTAVTSAPPATAARTPTGVIPAPRARKRHGKN